MTNIFFYGLFMDETLLTGQGLHPKVVGPAVLDGYRIHIGQRATLVPSAGERSYGIVMALSDEEAVALYAEPSVAEYVRERVSVELLDSGEAVEADCYNLPRDLALAGANPDYAAKLARLLASLGFNAAYVDEVAALGAAS